MDPSLAAERETLIVASEISSPLFLLELGLNYIQQKLYNEGIAFLILARERLSPHQIHLAAIIDTFLQEYGDYQRVQHTLQEVSLHFAEAHVKLQISVADFQRALLALTKEINIPERLPSPLIEIEQNQLPSSLSPDPCKPFLMQNETSLPELSITCFGHFEVRRSRKPVVLCSSRSGQRILRYLVVKPSHSATSDALQAMLWPEDEPEVAQRKLHNAISALRRSLNNGITCGPSCGYIVCKNRVYRLHPTATLHTDVEEFLRYYQAGQTSEERIQLYEKACRLYTGPFLLEDIYADWSFLQREQLSQIHLAMCRVLADYHLKARCYEDAARWATTVLNENRCDEAAHRQLMQIYAAQGRRSETLQQYQRCKHVLHKELGMQPLPETVRLFQALCADKPGSQKK